MFKNKKQEQRAWNTYRKARDEADKVCRKAIEKAWATYEKARDKK